MDAFVVQNVSLTIWQADLLSRFSPDRSVMVPGRLWMTFRLVTISMLFEIVTDLESVSITAYEILPRPPP